MKPALVIAAALGASALAQSPAPASQLLHTQTAFDITVPLPYAETAPLFGPEGERAWAGPHWDPHFVYPQPAHDEQGAVFTVQHGPVTATWVNTLYDLEGRHFIYAYFMPGVMVTTIDVRFISTAANSTRVHVLYTRTALTVEGNEHVTRLTVGDKSAAYEWQQAIETSLASRTKQRTPEK
ncbi:hypothetical protein [Occallatibacter savannae]|uniref:hypothetical protein n=1 Tax=Occallatibacter savannae TaxID=1002691 RepID=UPI000D686200|nr:hypothetical protein [Occallatibacter savannae]